MTLTHRFLQWTGTTFCQVGTLVLYLYNLQQYKSSEGQVNERQFLEGFIAVFRT